MILSPIHKAWLSGHPNRTAEWLKAIISHGFHVHHVDGDRENNNPQNLVLIEKVDHMKLHKKYGMPSRYNGKLGELCYYAKRQTGLPWAEIAAKLQVSENIAIKQAMAYGTRASLPTDFVRAPRGKNKPYPHPVYRGY